MLNKLLVFSMLLIMGCSDVLDEKHIEIDPIARISYDRFIKAALKHGLDFRNHDLIIKVDYTPNGKIGYSDYQQSIPTIVISKSYIDGMNEQMNEPYPDPNLQWYLEYTVMHELGHTFLLRAHVPEKDFSIMTCCMQHSWDYTNDDTRLQLQEELFNKKTFGTL